MLERLRDASYDAETHLMIFSVTLSLITYLSLHFEIPEIQRQFEKCYLCIIFIPADYAEHPVNRHTLLICPSTAWKIFCPGRSLSNQLHRQTAMVRDKSVEDAVYVRSARVNRFVATVLSTFDNRVNRPFPIPMLKA